MSSSRKKKIIKRLLITAAVLLAVFLTLPYIISAISKLFTAREQAIRTDWTENVSQLLGTDTEENVQLADAGLESELPVLRLIPDEIENDGFTYYDTAVQERLDRALDHLKTSGTDWRADAPLAVLNPYGTGSNGLYLYFTTDHPTAVSYTVSVDQEAIPDYTAEARDVSGEEYTREHEIQIIGLVPGETNTVTITMTGSWGNVRQEVTFSVDMPENRSGYPTMLNYTEGESGETLSDGLYAMMRTNGYLGYGFFYDNEGVMRYEMVLEGYGLDHILDLGDGTIITCTSSAKLARIDGLGRVLQVYSLDGYNLHHDIQPGPDGTVLALAEHEDTADVEDLVLEIDIESGTVTELLDFTDVMAAYYETETRPVAATDDFFWLAGDSAFWENTAYEEYCLEQEGDFVPQYGQHTVEYAGAGEEDGVYYIRMFNNNYWSLNTRDYEPDLDDSVRTGLYQSGSEVSQVYVYRIDENNRTFSLEESFPAPYSSIVSSAAPAGSSDNWVVNSGMDKVFGEYDSDGVLIREYEYICDMQGYRTFKYTMEGFWF